MANTKKNTKFLARFLLKSNFGELANFFQLWLPDTKSNLSGKSQSRQDQSFAVCRGQFTAMQPMTPIV